MSRLGIGIGVNIGGDVGGASGPPTQAEFLDVRDGVTPVLQLDFDRNLFYFNGSYYTTKAAYISAGGADLGAGRVPIAALGSAPWTWQFTGVCPATINASRNYAFSWYGGTTNLAYLRLDQSTNNSQYTVVNAGTTQAAITNPVAAFLGQSFVAAGVLGSNFGAYSSNGRDTGTPDTVLSLPAFNTGIALGYNPAAANGEWRGTFGTFTVWPGNLGVGMVRALSTGNKFGPSRVQLAGAGRDYVIDGYTYAARVANNGDQLFIKIRNDNREMVGIRSVQTGGPEDDHNMPNIIETDDGGMVWLSTNHDTGNVVSFSKSADHNMDNFPSRSLVTLGGGLIPAYGTLRKQASSGDLFFLFRTNQTFWSYITSTDHGASWSYAGRFLDDSAHSGDKLLTSATNWVTTSKLRCMANREPQYLDTDIRIFDIDVDSLDISSTSGSIGTVGTGNGALMSDCGTVWSPGSGFSAFCRDFKEWNHGIAGLLDEGTGIHSYYWLNCNNTEAPFVSTSWDKVLICAESVSGKSGGAHVIGVSGLTTPQVAIARYSAVDSQYHLEIWEASDAAGSSWSLLEEIATGGDSGDNKIFAPSSARNADAAVPLTWNLGNYANFDSFAAQAYWQKNAG